MEVGGTICPFRSTDQVLVNCESTCQLFFPVKSPQEGKCTLAFIPSLKQEIASLTNAIVNISRARTTLG